MAPLPAASVALSGDGQWRYRPVLGTRVGRGTAMRRSGLDGYFHRGGSSRYASARTRHSASRHHYHVHPRHGAQRWAVPGSAETDIPHDSQGARTPPHFHFHFHQHQHYYSHPGTRRRGRGSWVSAGTGSRTWRARGCGPTVMALPAAGRARSPCRP